MDGTQHPVSDTLSFGRTFASVKVYNIETGGAPLAVLHDAKQYTLRMNPSDTYLLVLANAAQQGKVGKR